MVMDGVSSEWKHMRTGVPQGSILLPLLFVIFVNDLPAVVKNCSMKLYADDTTIYTSNEDPSSVGQQLEEDLRAIAGWINANSLKMNVAKTQLMVLCGRSRQESAQSVHVRICDKELLKNFIYLPTYLASSKDSEIYQIGVASYANMLLL